MPKLTVNPLYGLGEIVYLVTDTESRPLMVLAYIIDVYGLIYWLDDGNKYYEMQLTKSPSITYSN